MMARAIAIPRSIRRNWFSQIPNGGSEGGEEMEGNCGP